ncbi:hypothetical protein RsS62_00500 [Rhizobium dioscoreae]|uniref:Uncharacterized protein n=1 Tax=Rhizobium dioscoreae TaxID=2653122 RepID=A0ABQ0Z5X4_9HYPH|nr:hypothetical protein RsS62_00500 [Rhizobium dioscoreae]GES50925.1 hypothetical protein RsS93_35390 [Rhizobium dioscoreae]GLU82376.1 hypothetical protein Rhsp01_35520 [Rhizobium sp. NBRC 114257]
MIKHRANLGPKRPAFKRVSDANVIAPSQQGTLSQSYECRQTRAPNIRPAADGSAKIDFHGEIPGTGAVPGQADHHQAERFQRLGHVQATNVKRTEP